MPVWNITPIWKDKECFIIGGGYSLKKSSFDWNLLKSEYTIGCNDAFQLGVSICKVCIFGDKKWFLGDTTRKLAGHQKQLELFTGMVFTNLPKLLHTDISWLNTLKRSGRGLHTDCLGWNQNTGFAAINLALLFGCSAIYLLGFDMKMIDGKHNWHNNRMDSSGDEVYRNFLQTQKRVQKDWKEKFPNQQIVNLVKPPPLDSNLTIFPCADFDSFWNKRKSA